MAEAVAEVVGFRVPVVRELDHRLLALVAISHEGEREAAVGIVLAPQELHPEDVGIEADRSLEIADADHRVKDAHGVTS